MFMYAPNLPLLLSRADNFILCNRPNSLIINYIMMSHQTTGQQLWFGYGGGA